MKRYHFALFTLMGNGHINPLLSLCSELVSRGHRVTCPTTGRYSHIFSAAGGEVVPYVETPVSLALRTENEAKSKLPLNHPRRLDTTELEWEHFVKSSNDILGQVSGYYDDDEPDVVLYNRYCMPGRIVANRAGAQAIQLSPHFAYHGGGRYWENGECVSPPSLADYAEGLDGFLARHGIRKSGNLWHIERLNIHFIPREFQYRSELFDDRFMFVGGVRDGQFSSTSRRAASKQPRILISGYSGLPETQYSNELYFKVFIEALAGADCQCILSIGDRMSPNALGSLPVNFEINQTVAHPEILPNVDLFACHGGMGSTLEALYSGVPVLAVPATPYTQEVAYRVEQLALGRSLPVERFTAGAVREAVGQMQRDRRLSEHVSEMREIFSRSDGASAAAERIERQLLAVA